jgi:uncharacterized protein (DUF1697 family)
MNITYIVLLRGINVSGQKKILMADLRSFLEGASFQNVQTHIQSGNIILESSISDTQKVAEKIKTLIKEKYGFDVPTLVRTRQYLIDVVNANPLVKQTETNSKKIYVTFLDKPPIVDIVGKLKAINYTPEVWVIHQDYIYFYSPENYGNAKMSNNLFEQKLKVSATTRNWRTINKLIELAGES